MTPEQIKARSNRGWQLAGLSLGVGGFALFVIAWLTLGSIHGAVAQTGEAPLSCRIVHGRSVPSGTFPTEAIQCTVTADHASITASSINRGHCNPYSAFQPGNYTMGGVITSSIDPGGMRSCNVVEWTITVDGTDWTWKAP